MAFVILDNPQAKSSAFYLYNPISQITHVPRGALQSVQQSKHPLALDP